MRRPRRPACTGLGLSALVWPTPLAERLLMPHLLIATGWGATLVPADPETERHIAAYAAACRARIPGFVARHFGVAGTLRLHREALGLDLLRAPLNVLLVAPALFLRVAAVVTRWLGLASLGNWLARRHLFVETRLSRKVAELVLDELLRLDDRTPAAWRDRSRHLIAEYVAARHAVAEFGAMIVLLLAGFVLLQALTPSAISLGPMLAQEMARREAVEGFWLGPWAGSMWYGWFPTDAGWSLLVLTTGAVMMSFALLATFTGLVMDPLQQALGLHQRRLTRLVDTLERAALTDTELELALPDPYIARLTDLVDVALIAFRVTR